MASLTLSINDEFRNQLKQFSWINWSEIAREEIMKKLIFEDYIKTGNLTDEEWELCKKIDWHPVDELPLKAEFIKKIKSLKKEKGIRFNSIGELRKSIEK